eukprot:jgi/Ulvmu1/12827/UM098_0008.1
MSGDADYLKATVGAALAQGVAECVCACPDDPVAFLGNWLKAHVQNASIKQQVCEEDARIAAEAEVAAKTQAMNEEAQKAAIARRESVVLKVQDCPGYPLDVWKSATNAVIEHTAVGSAYAMVVAPPEEPDFTFEEEEGEEAPESDDEPEDKPSDAPDVDGEDEPAEDAEAPQEPLAPATDAETVFKDRWDYSRHHLEFVTAAPDHQLPMISETPRLERPVVNADEDEEDVPKELPPVTMKMLDEHMPTLHVPCTLQEPRMKYLNEFPAIGAYFAAAVKQKVGSFSSILAADTLVPHGSGQPLSVEDRDLIWELARAVAARLERYPAARIQARTEACKYKSVDEIKEAMKVVRSGPAAFANEEEQPAPEVVATGEEEVAEAGGGAAELADEGLEEAEIDPEAEPAEKAAHFGKLVPYLQKKVAGLEASLKELQKKLGNETQCMDLVKEHITERQAEALDELHSYFHAPAATSHVLKAVFRLLGHDAAHSHTWHQTLENINTNLFDTLKSYSISTQCDDASWKAVRSAYKGAGDAKQARSRWAYELPVSCLGSILMLYIRQARKGLIAWRAVQATEEALATMTEKLVSGQTELSAAQAAVDAAAAAEAAAAEAEEGAEEGAAEEDAA